MGGFKNRYGYCLVVDCESCEGVRVWLVFVFLFHLCFRRLTIFLSTILNRAGANNNCMCNVIDDYREDELSESWLRIERRKRFY